MDKAGGGGVPRRIDHLGRIVVPVELRRQLGVRAGDELEIAVHENTIVLRPTRKACTFCGAEKDLESYLEHLVCGRCAREAAEQRSGGST